MLTTRATKRTAREHLSVDFRIDILEGETEIGKLVVRRSGDGEFTLKGAAFVISHEKGLGLGETPLEQTVRFFTKKPKPPPDRYEVKDDKGRTLAAAEQVKEVFSVDCEGTRYRFAKGPTSQLFALTGEGSDAPLGTVGQTKRFTSAMQVDLPDRIPRPAQIFLLCLLLTLFLQRQANSGT